MAVQNRRYINKMRQDAIRRSREMRKQASVRADRDIPPDDTETEIPETEDEIRPQSPPPTKQSVKNSLSSLITEFIGNPIDSDKLLIAAILLMLMKEGGDKRLILALGYILI